MEELGRCIEQVTLESIPLTLPLLVQAYIVGQIFEPFYLLARKASVSLLILCPRNLDLIFEL